MATANPTTTTVPDADIIAQASTLTVFDDAGKEVTFGSLLDGPKTIVVFIRHFFCGTCQQYVSQLATVRQDALDQADARLVVIGCGEWNPIKFYKEATNFQGPMYADPARALYKLFGFTETLALTPSGQEKPSYVARSLLGNVFRSIWDGPVKHPGMLGKQGPSSQNGGDFVFGLGNACTFASVMKHTEDHVEVAELMKQAGVAYP